MDCRYDRWDKDPGCRVVAPRATQLPHPKDTKKVPVYNRDDQHTFFVHADLV